MLVGHLPFYKRYVLVQLPVSRGRGPESVFALHIPKSDRVEGDEAPPMIWLNGDSYGIHLANEAEAIDLVEDHVLDYLRFFVNFRRQREGAFTLLDTTNLIVLSELTADETSDLTATERLELMATRDRFIAGTIIDPRVSRAIESGYEVVLPIAYGAEFSDLARFRISKNGPGERISVQIITEGQLRSVGMMSVVAIPEFPRISPSVLQARQR